MILAGDDEGKKRVRRLREAMLEAGREERGIRNTVKIFLNIGDFCSINASDDDMSPAVYP